MRIVIDTREIDAALGYLTEGVVRPAVRLALNDSGRQGNTAGKAEIRKKWNLTAAFVNERVGISAFANEQDLSLTIQATGRPVDLTHFGARWVKGNRVLTRQGARIPTRKEKKTGGGGVFYEAQKGVAGHLPSAFIATVTAGKSDTHVGVFSSVKGEYYTPRLGKYAGKKGRSKIYKKVVISIPSMFEQAAVFEAINRVVAEKFPERFAHHIDRAVDRIGQGTP